MVTQPLQTEESILVAEDTIRFVRPPIGLEQFTDYRLLRISPNLDPFVRMASVDQRGPAFVVVPPGALFPDYVIEIPEEDCNELGLCTNEDVLVLGIVTRRGVRVPTVNLLAPVVINKRTFAASQVVLDKSGYAVAVPINAPSAKVG